jgi:hypothetical protein
VTIFVVEQQKHRAQLLAKAKSYVVEAAANFAAFAAKHGGQKSFVAKATKVIIFTVALLLQKHSAQTFIINIKAAGT